MLGIKELCSILFSVLLAYSFTVKINLSCTDAPGRSSSVYNEVYIIQRIELKHIKRMQS